MFKVGQKVTKVFHGINGYEERADAIVHTIEDGVIYLDNGEGDPEGGITYNLQGKEIERFFLPMHSEIIPKDDHD